MGIIKDPTSWRVGFELGLAGFSFPYSKPRKPTAYLYNGIRLPALPDLVYPNAYIQETIVKGYFWLRVCESPAVWETYTNGNLRLEKVGNEKAYYLTPESQIWDERPCALVIHNEGTEGNKLIWANNDVYKPDGSILVLASEPVPVYE